MTSNRSKHLRIARTALPRLRFCCEFDDEDVVQDEIDPDDETPCALALISAHASFAVVTTSSTAASRMGAQ